MFVIVIAFIEIIAIEVINVRSNRDIYCGNIINNGMDVCAKNDDNSNSYDNNDGYYNVK